MISSNLHHPFVKDLAWLVEGHYIEQGFNLEPYWFDDIEKRLLLLDSDPEDLVMAVNACKSHFLGRYFETLFSFAIKHLSFLTIVREHFQIESEGKTLGEVDMLVETPQGELHQFEIAIKFYLERPDLHPHDWIGPNKNDSLFKKITRATEHQLSILYTKEGTLSIADVVNNKIPKAHLLIFGRLYMALESQYGIEKWCSLRQYGGWIRASDFMLLSSYYSHFYVLEKPHWMTFPELNNKFMLFSSQSTYNLVRKILQNERPIHIYLYQASTESSLENRSVFVVPDSW